MQDPQPVLVCKSCGASGAEKYCGQCGQPLSVSRITFGSLLHDVFHFFTHMDKGIGYTLKRLLLTPGKMQLEYIDGDRARHQKPFSMFFICATVAALIRYWTNLALIHFASGNLAEANFFHNYMVLVHIIMLPLYALITYLVFYESKFNYAEIGVFVLYTVSFFFLMVSCIVLLKFIWPNLDTVYVELPALAIYNAITCKNFFPESKRWVVILKSIAVAVSIFVVANLCEDLVQRFTS